MAAPTSSTKTTPAVPAGSLVGAKLNLDAAEHLALNLNEWAEKSRDPTQKGLAKKAAEAIHLSVKSAKQKKEVFAVFDFSPLKSLFPLLGLRDFRLRMVIDAHVPQAADSFSSISGSSGVIEEKNKEKAGKEKVRPAIDPAMSEISEAQNRAAKASRPDREGKKLVAGHFDVEVAERIKDLARARRTTVQAVLEEAVGDLFKKYDAGTLALDKFMQTFKKD